MATKRILHLKLDRHPLGFRRALVERDAGRASAGWGLIVESPSEVECFRDHLRSGTSMSFNMVTVEGDRWAGEAAVASLSDAFDAATLVLLSGLGPLRTA